MGNSPSNLSDHENEDIWWNEEIREAIQEEDPITPKESFQSFSEEFNKKRDQRKQILEQKRKEIQGIREELDILRRENERSRNTEVNKRDEVENEQLEHLKRQNQTLQEEIQTLKSREVNVEDIMEKNKELRSSVSDMQSELQRMNSSLLDFEEKKEDYRRHVVALKDVIKVSKELSQIRESELNELKEKSNSIEHAFNEREASLMSHNLKKEYEKQLQNMRNLRELYEERSRTYKREAAILKSNIEDKDKELEKNGKQICELQERIADLEKDTSDKYDTIKSLESNLGLVKAEARQYQAELAVINQLFSHILSAFNNSPELDFDKLLKRLEENHDLLKDIVNNEVSSEVSSALPKVLLDLVNQISHENEPNEIENSDKKKVLAVNEPTSSTHNSNSPAEIVENLPKVWRVSIELLSHQSTNSTNVSDQENSDEEDENRCYKTVTTSKGPSLVLSVSKTFFRLKELIVEKKTLEKDMNNLKQLNSHLECRLQEQEKRFEFVSTESSKTWSFVGKLQKEHKLSHTQEQISRYESAQKRKLLKELKDESEYSRGKWQEAREKNSKTEKEWLILRKEFAARRRPTVEDGSNSVESGYSDEREGSSDEEPGYETDISECNVKAEETCEDDVECGEIEQDCTIANGSNGSIAEDTEVLVSEDRESPISSSLLVQNEETDALGVLQLHNEIPSEERTTEEESTNDETERLMNDMDVQGPCCSSDVTNQEEGASSPSSDDRLSAEHEQCSSSIPTRTLEERSAARDERLKRLEGQCKASVSQVTNTSNKSMAICSKLEDLHEIYGDRESPNRRPTKDEGSDGSDEEES